MNYIQKELNTVELENIDSIYQFTREHRLEIFMGSDLQYEVHIDGEGSYGSWITFFGAMYGGIKEYNRQKSKKILL